MPGLDPGIYLIERKDGVPDAGSGEKHCTAEPGPLQRGFSFCGDPGSATQHFRAASRPGYGSCSKAGLAGGAAGAGYGPAKAGFHFA